MTMNIGGIVNALAYEGNFGELFSESPADKAAGQDLIAEQVNTAKRPDYAQVTPESEGSQGDPERGVQNNVGAANQAIEFQYQLEYAAVSAPEFKGDTGAKYPGKPKRPQIEVPFSSPPERPQGSFTLCTTGSSSLFAPQSMTGATGFLAGLQAPYSSALRHSSQAAALGGTTRGIANNIGN